MEPSKEAIAVRISRLNRQILGKVSAGSSKFSKKTIHREALFDALTVLYDECNDDAVKKCDDLVRAFVDKYRSTLAELRRIRVCISDFEILQTIGRGQLGDVHMVREKETHDVYALKCIRKEEARKRVAGAADERDILAGAAGPWAPKLQYAFQDNTNLYLVMELCSGGDLAGLLSRRHNPLSESDAAFYVAEVAHALKALHQLGFVHRDVKPNNILLDRCGHVKLGDFGSCARLSAGSSAGLAAGGAGAGAGGTADYVAPELLAAADCARRHAVCAECCRGVEHSALSACDYWSLGVVAFELVTQRRPFSSSDDDSIATILNNIQKYEQDSSPPFEAPPDGPSEPWRALVAGLLRVQPARRFNYLDTLQHPALAHLSVHSIRDQAPPWVPRVRGPEDATYFSPPPREPPPVSAAPFRARPPFAGQLPFVGYSYVAPDNNDETVSTSGFNGSHDCTAIDLATYKSSEKLLASRAREIASLQSKLAAAEAGAGAAADKLRRAADADHERTRAKLQAEITALSLQNKRLERQIEIEKEERMALERTNQELSSAVADRKCAELRVAQAQNDELASERDGLREGVARLEARVSEMQAECARAVAEADAARAQHKHYKAILEQAQDLRHRTLTELNVRAIDTIAKERALRRQTLSGGEAESREAAARAAAASALAAREARARELAEKRLADAEADARDLRKQLEDVRRELATVQETLGDKQRVASASTDQLKEAQLLLTQERVRASTLAAQVQELQRTLQEACAREAALEEQCSRTEARFNERLDAAEQRAAAALQEDARHREKVNTLEQLVRQLEREVTALESRACGTCEPRTPRDSPDKRAHSDTESVGDAHAHAHAHVLREQLERAEAQLQTRAEEIAALRQEARTANLARWRKEREFNELSVEAKSTARDLKRAEERLTSVLEAKRAAERKATEVQAELDALKPQFEQATKEAERVKQQLASLLKRHETAEAEVDRSRNDIRKLKSELQYSEKRRLHAEEQEEMSSRERAQLRDENVELRAHNTELAQVSVVWCRARRLRAEQQEEMSSRERAQLRDENVELRAHNTELAQVSVVWCRARRLRAEQQEEMSSRERAQLRDENVELRAHNTELAQVSVVWCRARRLRAEQQEEMSSRERAQLRDENVELRAHNTELAQVSVVWCRARRLRAEQQEEMSSRERAQLRDENVELRAHNTELAQVSVVWCSARRLRAEQQEEMSSRERAQLRDENVELRAHNTELAQVSVVWCSARRLRAEQQEEMSSRERAQLRDENVELRAHNTELAQVSVVWCRARRLRAEQQEEMSSRERAQLRDENVELRAHNTELAQVSVVWCSARRLRAEQQEEMSSRERAQLRDENVELRAHNTELAQVSVVWCRARRLRAEQQEEMSSRERAQLRDENVELRAHNTELAQVSVVWCRARRLRAEQQEEMSSRERAQLRDENVELRAHNTELAQVSVVWCRARRLRAEQQEEMSSRERAQLRDENVELRAHNTELAQVSVVWCRARRLRAEQQEEMSSRERAQLRDENVELRAHNTELAQVSVVWCSARRLRAEQQEEMSSRERAQLRDENVELRAHNTELAQVSVVWCRARRLRAEQQEEMSSRERAQLRDENVELRAHNTELAQVSVVWCSARRLRAEQQEEMSSRERAQLRDENVELRAHNTELAQVSVVWCRARRLRAEQQEEMSSRERAQLRDENVELRAHNTELAQVSVVWCSARRLRAEQQEEMSSRERAQLRDENVELRAHNTELAQVSVVWCSARRLRAEQQEEMSSRERAQLRDENVELRAHNTELAQVSVVWCSARRLRAEQQEEMSSRERAQLRDENVELRAHNTELAQNNKALQEACSLLEEQLLDLEKLSDLNEGKSKNLEAEVHRLRTELSQLQEKLGGALSTAAERSASAAAAAQGLERARDQHRHAAAQLQLLQERVERGDARVAALEARCASLESERAAAQAALGSAARRVRDLQEECAQLRTRAHDHHEQALQLRAQLDEALEHLESAREAAEAATAWWRTRETKADATLRQQAKLIDFLQAKVEEAGRKKCSLSNKLFGRSGRRPNASPPLRRANRELRDEVDRLRAKLAASSFNEINFPPTPVREPKTLNGTIKSIDTPDCAWTNSTQDSFLQIVWRDGSRERMSARLVDGALLLRGAGGGGGGGGGGGRELRARLAASAAPGLPFNEAGRAFTIAIEEPDSRGDTASAVCGDRAARSYWLGALRPAPPPAAAAAAPPGYVPRVLHTLETRPLCAAVLAEDAVAIGCEDGLQSLRGPVQLVLAGGSPGGGVPLLALCGTRALAARRGALLHAPAPALCSALRRAAPLQPSVPVDKVPLPDTAQPHLIAGVTGGSGDSTCAVGLGRRVVVLRWDAAAAAYSAARAFGLERAPAAVLLAPRALYVAAERPLRAALPAGALEPFAVADPTVAAAARNRSLPKAILLVNAEPAELLLCYAECGVFVDDAGRRTRPEDAKWSAAVQSFAFVRPFLYAVGEDRVTILHIGDEAYRAPVCTCDSTSMASSGSEYCGPDTFNVRLPEPTLLGTAADGIVVGTKCEAGYRVSLVDGRAAFRSVGTSLESLSVASEKGSTADLAVCFDDLSPQSPGDTSQETLNGATGFLADIKKRAKQLREKNRKQSQMEADEVIKEILTTEIGLKRGLSGRKSPALTSEFDSDSDTRSDLSADARRANDMCADMFTRQVRFQ